MRDPAGRARALMQRPGAWLEARGGGYVLRQGMDRRARIVATLDEAGFRAVVEHPGLAARPGGGWVVRRAAPDIALRPPGRPGVVEGRREVMLPDGSIVSRRANLGESPIAWLARRKDHSGRPWLTPGEVAAGEKLRMDAEIAGTGPSLTMRWDALPRSGAGSGVDSGPGDRALAAARRVQAALTAAGPDARPMLERVCIHGSALQLAEQDLGLRRRQGKTVLKRGLARLAAHYGWG